MSGDHRVRYYGRSRRKYYRNQSDGNIEYLNNEEFYVFRRM